MMIGAISPMDLVIAASAFGAVMSLWVIFMLIQHNRSKSRSDKIKDRLDFGAKRPTDENGKVLRLWHDGKEVTTTITSAHKKLSPMGRVEKLRRAAGFKMSARSLLISLITWPCAVFTITFLVTFSLSIALAVMMTLAVIFSSYLRSKIASRTLLFERQLVDALGLAARSLRAGHPLLGAFSVISEEIDDPIGSIFADICQQQAMGVGIEDAIHTATVECDHPDMAMFTTSMKIQLRSGGNLADMMQKLQSVIRDRIRLGRRVRVLTAQTQLSKRILLALPILLFAAMNALSPDYMDPLYTTSIGRMLLMIGVGGLLSGAWLMNRLAVVKF